MEKSKELVTQAGIVPNLQLATQQERGGVKSTGPHTVKIIEEKLINTTNYETGKQVPTMRYFFEENGERKQYDVEVKDKNGNLDYRIQKISQFEIGQILVIEVKKKGIKNYTDIRLSDNEVKEDEIPVINENENTYENQPTTFEEQLKS